MRPDLIPCQAGGFQNDPSFEIIKGRGRRTEGDKWSRVEGTQGRKSEKGDP